ncbi:TRL-like family protein [Dasania sp. GY-MA-18]|uniref:TRL-like family protein n=1 Tax=Dasania phycosphaerae TaxID=2950436 RepID=A0A9J6RKV4_9GAMM|nr:MULTISPECIES: TRL-like family protein [Dasania]MCR8922533.1 TRL-like family protein [Dasania sp. GY-MA-18]MCZ0864961.1 TRL-like family protein [Dasania phycosphaerae]MCZ0868689.1 TRL-like family protein [Dasania phycosphaerae]
MFKKLVLSIAIILVTGCATATKDLANTLRYADGQRVGVKNIEFQNLRTRKKGEACTWNLLFFIPMLGDGSIISAAENGEINNVELIGETGLWYFPFNKNCTVVYGNGEESGL